MHVYIYIYIYIYICIHIDMDACQVHIITKDEIITKKLKGRMD